MNQFPHTYSVAASAAVEGNVALERDGLETMESAAPVEFGGPGDKWSPEDLLVAAVADCFILSFRAIAAASKFAWQDLKCEVTGTLDRVERKVCFTQFAIKATLTLAGDSTVDRAKNLLQKAENTCFITNSLSATKNLDIEVLPA